MTIYTITRKETGGDVHFTVAYTSAALVEQAILDDIRELGGIYVRSDYTVHEARVVKRDSGALCYPVKAAKEEAAKEEAPASEAQVVIASVEEPPRAASVWCDFGSGEYQKFDFQTEAEQNAFADGILTAGNEWGQDDYRICFTEEQLADALEDEGIISLEQSAEEGGDECQA